jgi:glycosyltransferase involved in cell wall biosynthesis
VLSVVIPVYDEAGTIARVVSHVAAVVRGPAKEVFVVRDCAKDDTAEWLRCNLPPAEARAKRARARGLSR